MHSLTVVFGPGPAAWQLLFKTAETARVAYDKLTATPETTFNAGVGFGVIEDEFGQRATIRYADIHGVMLEDLNESRLAHIERALHEARTRSTITTRAQSDPSLRAGVVQHGPPVLQQMGNGRF